MKTMIFLLVSAVVLLLSSAGPLSTARQNLNLNDIIDQVKLYNATLNKELYVEDVLPLVEAGCENKFFCKVHDILHKHEHFGKRKIAKEEEGIVRNLKLFINGTKANCTVLLQNETSPTVKIQIHQLVEYLVTCSQKRNLSGR